MAFPCEMPPRPGDGTGHLDARMASGFIIEEWPKHVAGEPECCPNAYTVKRSLYVDGSVRKIDVVKVKAR